MKKILVVMVLSVIFNINWVKAEKKLEGMPPGVNAAHEMAQGNVLKVYSAEDKGALFRSYVVRWKEQEIVVRDPLGQSNKKAGEIIKFMVMRMEMMLGGKKLKLLQFTFIDLPDPPVNKPEIEQNLHEK